METKEFLNKICSLDGVSGYEAKTAQAVRDEFACHCDDAYIDGFGNVIGVKKGRGAGKIMFCAHMDEIGLMVREIDENGYVGFSTIGGFDPRTLVAQEVVIHGNKDRNKDGNKDIFGVIGILPPHLTKPGDQKKAIEIEKMAIDTGYTADSLKQLISIGSTITLKREFVQLQNGRLAGKALDDRAGVAALREAMINLLHYDHSADVYFVASVQEEIGGRGAETASYNIQPDIGIAIDVGFARAPEHKEENTIEMGKGPSIGTGINIHPAVCAKLRDAAKRNNINYQTEVYAGMSGTDATEIQISRSGVASGVVSIPLKYMHSPVETVSLTEIAQTGRLLSAFVMELNDMDLEAVLCY